MPPNSKKGKKKSKSKQHAKKASSLSSQVSNVQVFDEEGDYPTSRVIKRAPNGDVVVESLPQENSKRREYAGSDRRRSSSVNKSQASISVTLDSHWESLTSSEKRDILRIERDEVFEVLRDYQISQSCTCSVCGRRHMSMENELERIYETLYEMDRERDSELDPIKFHLSIIKELQSFKMQGSPSSDEKGILSGVNLDVDETSSTNEYENMRDEVVKYFLSSDAVDTLKEEVMNFKQHKQEQYNHDNMIQLNDETEKRAKILTDEESRFTVDTPVQKKDLMHSTAKNIAIDNKNEDLQAKYMKFAKTFVSSHPKIAEEYVNRMMMYPDMRALTDDLMNNNGQEFVRAIEDFVMEKEQFSTTQSLNPNQVQESCGKELDLNKIEHRNDSKEYAPIRHDGTILTPEEYNKLQHMIANSIVNSYDRTTDQFGEISSIERELFTRFIYGEDKKKFRSILGQTYNEKMSKHDPEIDISLAAAATTTASFGIMKGNDVQTHGLGPKVEMDMLENNDFDETFDEYSDYDHDEEDILDDDGDDEREEEEEEEEEFDDDEEPVEDLEGRGKDVNIASDFDDEEFDDQQYEDNSGQCIHPFHGGKAHNHRCDDSSDVDHSQSHHCGHTHDHDEEYDEEEYEEDEQYESSLDESGRIEEGRKLIQIAITKLLQGRILDSYHERQAETNRLRLLQELEAEEQKKKAKEEKKHKKREKEKEKKKALQLAKEEENRRKEQEAERIKKEAEEREKQRREAQRKKVEEAKRKKDEEKRRKLEDQRRREEEQERQRKLKEEQKRKREEEKKLKEEEKRRREQDKRYKEQMKEEQERRKAQELEKLKVQQTVDEKDLLTDNKLPDAIYQSSQARQSRYNTISPNVPYGSIGNQFTHNTSQNINHEIMNMINSVSTSKPKEPSPSPNFGTLLHTSGASREPLMTNSETYLFDPSNMMQSSSFPNDNISFDPGSCIHPSPPPKEPEQPMSTQNFGLPWNSFPNNLNPQNDYTLPQNSNQFQAAQEQAQPDSHHTGGSNFPLNGTEPRTEEYFVDEMDNLAKLLNSAGLSDSTVRTNSAEGQNLLWNNRRAVATSSNGASMHIEANNIPQVALNGLNSFSPQVGHPIQQTSIWSDINNSSSHQGELSSLSKSLAPTTSSYLSSNIWGTSGSSGMSFLSNPKDASKPNGNTLSKAIHPTSIATANDNDAQVSENIYKTYTAFCPAQNSQYIPVDLLHQNSMCRSLDESTFLSHLMNMRNSHDCEILTDSSGSATHARMAKKAYCDLNMTTQSHEKLLGDLYANPTQLQEELGNASGSGVNSTISLNSQMLPLGHHLSPSSSITSHFWG